MNRLDDRLKKGLGMFTQKADDIAAVEDRFQRIDKPPTQRRFLQNWQQEGVRPCPRLTSRSYEVYRKVNNLQEIGRLQEFL